MKLKLTFVAALLAMGSNVNAANYLVSNVGTGYGYSDALFQNVDDSLLSGGIVALGYFATVAPSSELSQIGSTISNFTITASALAGSYSASLGGNFAGYVEAPLVNGAPLISPADDAFIGLDLYVFAGNAATLETSTSWALVRISTLTEDLPLENTYQAQPFGFTPLIGSIGTFDGISPISGDPETYSTLQLAAVPEPSAVMLGALAASLGLLRRRRI